MLTYTIPEEPGTPKYKYLYERIRQDIISGTLKTGEKLPSKRALAAHLGISVITVENAYLLLAEEGYIVSRERSGFYIAKLTPLYKDKSVRRPALRSVIRPDDFPENLEAGDLRQPLQNDEQASQRSSHKDEQSSLRSQQPSRQAPSHQYQMSAHFPLSEYRKVMRGVLSGSDVCLLVKSPPFGCDVLRNALADYLLRYRGIRVAPEQIIIGSGSEHLYSLLVLFLGREKIFGLEDPSFEKIRQVYEANGAVCEMLPMDSTGITSQALERTNAGILHVTPFHSFPTGITASAAKRLEYINWAYSHDGLIIEDDIDSEFAVSTHPVETIFSMDQKGSVIYMNTFSRSMTPAVRVAYLVLPEKMTADFQQKLAFHSCTVPTLDQYVLAEFIAQGYFERHLNRLRRRLRQNS